MQGECSTMTRGPVRPLENAAAMRATLCGKATKCERGGPALIAGFLNDFALAAFIVLRTALRLIFVVKVVHHHSGIL